MSKLILTKNLQKNYIICTMKDNSITLAKVSIAEYGLQEIVFIQKN